MTHDENCEGSVLPFQTEIIAWIALTSFKIGFEVQYFPKIFITNDSNIPNWFENVRVTVLRIRSDVVNLSRVSLAEWYSCLLYTSDAADE